MVVGEVLGQHLGVSALADTGCSEEEYDFLIGEVGDCSEVETDSHSY